MANRFYLVILILLTIPLRGHGPSENIEEEPSIPNFLWLTIEDTSEYQFGCYGNQDIETPTIDMLAGKGIQYTNASSTAPHCSPARSTLITGCYATTFGMDIHREDYDTPDNIFYPQYLREAGYFCTNNAKTDYNTTINDNSLWDECGREAVYHSSTRKPGQPFFSVFNPLPLGRQPPWSLKKKIMVFSSSPLILRSSRNARTQPSASREASNWYASSDRMAGKSGTCSGN